MRLGVSSQGPLERIALASGTVPTPVFESLGAIAMGRILLAGSTLGLYDALHEQPDDAAGVARRLELDEQGVDVLLTALHATGYVRLDDRGRYHLDGPAERFLAPGADPSLRAWLEFQADIWDHFGRLEDVVRGGADDGLHAKPADDAYWERYMRGLFDLSQLSADLVARLIGAREPRRLLDVAGGHGGYAIGLLRRHPNLTAEIVELEGAARIGRQIVEEAGFAERVQFRVADMLSDDLGSGFDIVTAHQIVHHLDPDTARGLVRKLKDALAPGGTLAILEQDRSAGRRPGDQVGAYAGVLFYVTSRARTYSAEEIEEWLRDAGLEGVRSRRNAHIPGLALTLGRA